MDSASVALPDLDGLSIAELKTLVHEQHAQIVANALLIETLKLQILKLRRLQFGHRSEKREREIEQLELWVEELEAADARLTYSLVERAQSAPAASTPKPRRDGINGGAAAGEGTDVGGGAGHDMVIITTGKDSGTLYSWRPTDQGRRPPT